MTCFSIIAAAGTALAFAVGAAGSPIARNDIVIDGLLGFDKAIADKSEGFKVANIDVHCPEIQVLQSEHVGNGSLVAISGFNPSAEHVSKRFLVDDVDDRTLFNMASFPFNAVGRLVWSNGVFCSGALVGPKHILTAKHCVVDTKGVTATFSPGFDEEVRFGSGGVVLAVTSGDQVKGSPCETKGDWAVMLLDTRLGDDVGFFGVKLPDAKQFGIPKFYHMGYPGDKDGGTRPYRQAKLSVDSKRSFDCDGTGPFYNNADTAGGQSGGPMWELDEEGNRWIWGPLSIGVTSSREQYSGFASGDEMLEAVQRLRTEFP